MRTGRQIAERWLFDRLNVITDEVYRAPAPNEAGYPLLAIQLMSGRDIRAVGNPTAVEQLLFDVSAWDTGTSASRVQALACSVLQAIDSVEPEDVDGGIILACKRHSLIPITTSIENSGLYQRDGAVYEVTVLVKRD